MNEWMSAMKSQVACKWVSFYVFVCELQLRVVH